VAGGQVLAPSRCRRWACPDCGPRKARKLAKRIQQTKAQRFITLTIRPDPARTPEAQLDRLTAAWRTIFKRLKREHHGKALGYVRIVELTRRGTPHLHIAYIGPYVPQRRLSAWMNELVGSPIVDIRRIKTEAGLARYLAKYLTKAHETLASRRKWSASKHTLPPEEKPQLEPGELRIEWKWLRGDQDHVLAQFLTSGYSLFAQGRCMVALAPT
jgi:hypothetical protein